MKEVGLIDELAGTGYQETGRDIQCPVDGCEWLFTRNYDLKRHIASMHRESPEDEEDDDETEDEDMEELDPVLFDGR